MKRVMTILATALLASGVLATAAEAGGDGYMGGSGGHVHMRGGFRRRHRIRGRQTRPQ